MRRLTPWDRFCRKDAESVRALKRISSRKKSRKYWPRRQIADELTNYRETICSFVYEIRHSNYTYDDLRWYGHQLTIAVDCLQDFIKDEFSSYPEDFIMYLSGYFSEMKGAISHFERETFSESHGRRIPYKKAAFFGALDLPGLCLCYPPPYFLTRK